MVASPRCGIILAAGEGKRLQAFVQRMRGDRLPKQYLNLFGDRSMLQHTLARAERLIQPQRIFTVVSRHHLNYPEVRQQLSAREIGTVVAQPENKETAPGVLLPLAHLYKQYPNSTVTVFPSDHFIAEEALFMAHVDLACRLVESYPQYLVLLGIAPQTPETDYGYIVPGKSIKHLEALAVRPVLQFREKPDLESAEAMMDAGGLWNTMVMIFRAQTLVELIGRVSPRLHGFFERLCDAIGRKSERRVIEENYRRLEPVNFSTGILEPIARDSRRLLVLPVRNVHWSDWGSERRIAKTLETIGGHDGDRAAQTQASPIF